jgi:hypothetical protein
MALGERIAYAVLGAIFGALIGTVCWWLYGLALSLNYDGPGMDPILRHWLTFSTAAYAALGFIFGERAGDIVGDSLSAIFHFEIDEVPGQSAGAVVGLVLILIIVAAVWFTVPS